MPEAGPGQPEVTGHVPGLLPGNGDAESLRMGEVRQGHPARFVPLPEHGLLPGAVLRLPVADPPLRGAPDIRTLLRMAAPQLLEDADRAQARAILEHRRHLLLPDPGQRVRPSPAPRGPAVRRKHRVPLDAGAGGCAMPAFADAVSTERVLPYSMKSLT